ncbi:putative amidophosphoribosyltransferase [Glaciihabitans tibetensis]|uniref:Putative amidophosphoribosyltransferase n=1 Tax=Glaciihabitans tibetensis TaxID=1266600 RepID=A0A2T0VFJ8_9MICO|nr:phosphoribosyltransferase family protein [Glaciihabitans tibetensis]PRY68946.1 putative amidophosphoribosyltransferase [Glaciihabitans tibetensis]
MNSLVAALSRSLLDALAVFFPVDCEGCSAPDRVVCASCREQLVPEVAARILPNGLTVYTALIYHSVPRRLVLALKEEGRTEIARYLAVPLRAAIQVTQDRLLTRNAEPTSPPHRALTPPELAPVPTSSAAWRRRGFDPVALLCRRAGYRPSRVLVSARRTRSQKTLGEHERAANLTGSMRSRMSLEGRRFVIVDDVLTTGATLGEARRAIVAAGGEVVCAVAVAYTPRVIQHGAFEKKVVSDIASQGVYGEQHKARKVIAWHTGGAQVSRRSAWKFPSPVETWA